MSESTTSPASQRSRLLLGLILAVLALVAVALYLPTLRLPLIYDDLLHIRIAKGLDLRTVWLPTDDFGFYRPLTFLPLLLIKGVFGTYPSELLHGLNVLQHALNAALLTALSWRLWRRAHWALAAGALFIIFPFSYQAIAVYGHNVHPTTAGILLAALHTYLSALRDQSRAWIWWIGTVVLFILGLLSHESAVLFGPLAALVQWNETGLVVGGDRKNLAAAAERILWKPWFPFLLAGVIYAIGYQFLDLSRAPQTSFGDQALWYKFLYLGQGAAFPLAWIGRFLEGTEPVAAAVVLVGLGIMTALTVWSARDERNRLPLLMGWGWWVMASLLVALPLETGYFLHGPRLLYLSSAGLAFLWPVLLEPLYSRVRFGRITWAAILLVVMVVQWIYVRERLADYRQLTDVVDLAEEKMANRPEDEGVLLVNLPQWIDQLDETYLVGVDLAAMMGDYLFVGELIGENLPGNRPALAFRAPDLLSFPSGYNFGIHEETQGSAIVDKWAPSGSSIFVSFYPEEGIQAQFTGRILPTSDSPDVAAVMGPYKLTGADAQQCGKRLDVVTKWRLAVGTEPYNVVPPTTSIFVQYIDNNGQIVNQFDGPLLSLVPDYLNLDSDWQVEDVRTLDVPEGQGGQLLLGVYDYVSGDRYPALDAEGNSLANDAFVIPLEPCSN